MAYAGDEAFRAHVHRHAAWLRYEHGATRDGELVYVKAEVLLDGGAYTSSSPGVVTSAACFAAGPYRVRSAEIDVRATCTNTPPCGALPGFGAVQVAVAHEAQMDLLAAELGLDPIDLRLRNALVAGDLLVTGQAIDGAVPVRELLERLRAMPIPPDHRTSPVDLRELPGGMSNSTHGEDVTRGVGYAIGFRNAAMPDAPALAADGEEPAAAGVTLCFAAHRAVCDVDRALGIVRVVEVATTQDLGRIENLVQCEARVQGGIAQGLGLALMEELRVDDGVVQNAGFADYLIPTILDMPPVRMELLETQPEAAEGLNGIGEPPAIASTPAIAAALRAATGRPVTRVPVRPDDLLAAAVTLDEINALDREAFTIRLGHIATGSPWVAYGAWDYRPFADALELVAAFRGAIARAEDERQLALIEAHAAPPGEGDAYRERFGFPFVLCTHQRSADAQLAAYEQRLTHEPELEMAIALDEVVKIIRLKIADLLAV